MAKQIYKSGLDVAGLSVEDIIKMDYETINKLSRQDLSRITSRLASAGNKRLRRIEKAGVQSPAYESVQRSGGNFSVKGKSVNQLRAEFARVQRFLSPETKTSTVKGAREYKKKFGKYTEGLTDEQTANFFDVLHKLQEEDPSFFKDQMKYNNVSEIISERIKRADPEVLLSELREKLTNIYEESERVLNDTSSLFNELFDDLPPVGN